MLTAVASYTARPKFVNDHFSGHIAHRCQQSIYKKVYLSYLLKVFPTDLAHVELCKSLNKVLKLENILEWALLSAGVKTTSSYMVYHDCCYFSFVILTKFCRKASFY